MVAKLQGHTNVVVSYTCIMHVFYFGKDRLLCTLYMFDAVIVCI